MLIGFELGIELTFPTEECTTAGIIFSMSQILGVVFTVFVGHLNQSFGCYWALVSQVIFLSLGTIITALVPNKLNRQEAFKTMDPVRKASYQGSRLVFIE